MLNSIINMFARALFTHPIIITFMNIPRYKALKLLRNFAGLPEYLNSANSASVIIPERLQSFAKKKTVSTPPKAKFHQIQFPAIPFFATNSVTASGVSAAKVVATIDNPARYQGKFLPERKNSVVFLLLLLE